MASTVPEAERRKYEDDFLNAPRSATNARTKAAATGATGTRHPASSASHRAVAGVDGQPAITRPASRSSSIRRIS